MLLGIGVSDGVGPPGVLVGGMVKANANVHCSFDAGVGVMSITCACGSSGVTGLACCNLTLIKSVVTPKPIVPSNNSPTYQYCLINLILLPYSC